VKSATDRGLKVLIVPMEAPGNFGPDYKADFDALYSDIATTYGAAITQPFFRLLDAEATDPGQIRQWMQADGIHPNKDGVARVVASLGVGRALLPLGAAMHLPLLGILWLAHHPDASRLQVGLLYFGEYVAYGAGVCALLLAMMKFAAGPQAAVRYAALSTLALVANYLPGFWAGASCMSSMLAGRGSRPDTHSTQSATVGQVLVEALEPTTKPKCPARIITS
jgi:hypothetical protein